MSDVPANERGWGPGYPHCQTGKMVTIHPTGRALTVRAEAATVFDYLVRRYDAEVEDINAQADDWGFACRPIRGTANTPSNHSWGLAVDLNAAKHPQGSPHTFTNTQLLNGHLIVAETHFFRWGQDYADADRIDGMHWEFMGTPTDCAGLTKRIKNLKPWPAYDGHPISIGTSGPRAALVNSRLGFPITSTTFTARSAYYLRGFQASRHLPVSGRVDALTWKRLEWRLP